MTPQRGPRPWWILVGVTTLVAAIAFVYRGTRVVSESARARLSRELEATAHADSDVKRLALAVRSGIVRQYDSVLERARGLEASARRLEGLLADVFDELAGGWLSASHVEGSEGEADDWLGLCVAWHRMRAAIDNQRTALERFHSHNAVLSNSTRYLPTAVTEVRSLLGSAEHDPLAAAVDNVVFRVYAFSSFREQESGLALVESLSQLHAAVGALGELGTETALTHAARRLYQHGSICSAEMRATDRFLHDVLNTPVASAIRGIEGAVAARLLRQSRVAAIYRGVLYCLTVLLALGVIGGVGWLRHLYGTLEHRVRDRTRDLREAKEQVQRLYDANRAVLDNVQEGLLTMTLDGALGAEHSRIVERWFGVPRAQESVGEWLGRADSGFGRMLELGLEQLRDGFLPKALLVEQLPTRIRAADRIYSVGYHPLDGGSQQAGFLAMITDITERLQAERARNRQEQVVALAQRFHRDPRATDEFLRESALLLTTIRDDEDVHRVRAALHTVKGNASLYELRALVDLLHSIESSVQDSGRLPRPEELRQLDSEWAELMGGVAPFLESMARDALLLATSDLELLKKAIGAGAAHSDLAHQLDWLCSEASHSRLDHLAETIRSVARRLDRVEPEIEIVADEIRLRPEAWQGFWSAAVHVARNMVDHGLEAAEDRMKVGKPKQGRIELSATVTAAGLLVRFADDGRGIDWLRIAELARARGLPADTEEEQMDALFSEGLSTKETVTEFSGRGVGLSAVRAACAELRGKIRVRSAVGKGTEWLCTFPRDPALWLSAPPTGVGAGA